MTLSEIHLALTAAEQTPDARFAGVEPFAALTAFALLTRIVGLPLAAFDLPPPKLSVRFPKAAIPDDAARVFGAELQRYQAWRRLLLDCQMLATRVAVDDDPLDGLRRVTRLTLGASQANALHALGNHFAGVAPSEITLERAIEIERGLSDAARQGFRRAWAVIVRLSGHELAVATGVLPAGFGQLPEPSRLQPHLPLPPQLGALAAAAGRSVESAATYCWTLAVAAGLVEAHADPAPAEAFTPEAWKRLADVDPTTEGIAVLNYTFDIYLGRFARMLIAAGAADPRVDHVEAAWRQLMAAVRATKASGNVLSVIAPQAKAEGMRPQDISGAWIARMLAAAPDEARIRAIRSAAFFLDGLRCDVPLHLLPDQPTGLARRRMPKAAPPPRASGDPIEKA